MQSPRPLSSSTCAIAKTPNFQVQTNYAVLYSILSVTDITRLDSVLIEKIRGLLAAYSPPKESQFDETSSSELSAGATTGGDDWIQLSSHLQLTASKLAEGSLRFFDAIVSISHTQFLPSPYPSISVSAKLSPVFFRSALGLAVVHQLIANITCCRPGAAERSSPLHMVLTESLSIPLAHYHQDLCSASPPEILVRPKPPLGVIFLSLVRFC